MTDRPLDSICVEGKCVDVGLRSDEGETRLSNILLYSRFPPALKNLAVGAWSSTIFHPTRPDGSELRCADVLALPPDARRNAGETNAVAWNSGGMLKKLEGDTLTNPVYAIPVNEPGVHYLVLSELFAGAIDARTGEPTGALLAEGCAEGFVAVEGSYDAHPGDSRFRFVVDVALAPAR